MSELYEKLKVPIQPVETRTVFRCKECGKDHYYESRFRQHHWNEHASYTVKRVELDIDPNEDVALDSTLYYFPNQDLFDLYIDSNSNFARSDKQKWAGSGWYESWVASDGDHSVRPIEDSITSLRALSMRVNDQLRRLTVMSVDGADYKEAE